MSKKILALIIEGTSDVLKLYAALVVAPFCAVADFVRHNGRRHGHTRPSEGVGAH
jgi:hypothetical protein